MLVKPTVPELLKKSGKNRYSLVIGTAKRARQISNGSKAKTAEDEPSPVTIAAEEIGEGKVTILDEQEWEEREPQTQPQPQPEESKEQKPENE